MALLEFNRTCLQKLLILQQSLKFKNFHLIKYVHWEQLHRSLSHTECLPISTSNWLHSKCVSLSKWQNCHFQLTCINMLSITWLNSTSAYSIGKRWPFEKVNHLTLWWIYLIVRIKKLEVNFKKNSCRNKFIL